MQFLAKKILLELYLPMTVYNSKKNLMILHFQTSLRQLATHTIYTFETGLLLGCYTDERNYLCTENRI